MSVMAGANLAGGLSMGPTPVNHGAGWNARYPSFNYDQVSRPILPPPDCCDYYCCFNGSYWTTCPCPSNGNGGSGCGPNGDQPCDCGGCSHPPQPTGGAHPQSLRSSCPIMACLDSAGVPPPGLAPVAVPGSGSTYHHDVNVVTSNSNVQWLWVTCTETGVTLQSICGRVSFYHDTTGTKHYKSAAGLAKHCTFGFTQHYSSGSAQATLPPSGNVTISVS